MSGSKCAFAPDIIYSKRQINMPFTISNNRLVLKEGEVEYGRRKRTGGIFPGRQNSDR